MTTTTIKMYCYPTACNRITDLDHSMSPKEARSSLFDTCPPSVGRAEGRRTGTKLLVTITYLSSTVVDGGRPWRLDDATTWSSLSTHDRRLVTSHRCCRVYRKINVTLIRACSPVPRSSLKGKTRLFSRHPLTSVCASAYSLFSFSLSLSLSCSL